MKLKAGGKAIVIAVVVGAIGFGANHFGVFDKKAKPVPEAAVVAEEDEAPAPQQEVQPRKEAPRKVVQEQVEEQVTPAPAPKQDVSMNRGMAAVMAAGQK